MIVDAVAFLCIVVVTFDAGVRLVRLLSLRADDAERRELAREIAEGTDEEASAALQLLTKVQVSDDELRRLELHASEVEHATIGLVLFSAIAELKGHRSVELGVRMIAIQSRLDAEKRARDNARRLELEGAIEAAATRALEKESAKARAVGDQLTIDMMRGTP